MQASRRAALKGLAWLAVAPAARAQSAPRWYDGSAPNAAARSALALLAGAASHGLDAAEYSVPPFDAADPARWERALDAAMLLFLRHLRDGRVAPQSVGARFPPAWRTPFDAEALLADALARGDVADAVRRAEPPVPQVRRLRVLLAQLRGLGDHAAWRQPLPALPLPAGRRARALEPGATWAGLARLADRLVALGDLPAAANALPPETYTPTLVDAVRAFQERHGLEADGVVGRTTASALDVAPARRARQVELTLERLRWTPLLHAPRMVVVNVPEFVLRAYEVDAAGRIALRVESKVVVGRALDTRTPIFGEDMRRIEFQPFWNVPPSIARGELIPRLRRDRAHWAREGFEFVGADGRADAVLSDAKLAAVLAGQLRIRQRPGPRNALGDIKFVFPNRDNIYLHHTPSVQLFGRARRDFSHGCIRVEQPVALAAFALAGLPGWDEARIRRAMEDDPPATVALAAPLPVLIAYGTVLVKDTRAYFFDDLYGHDRVLDAALRARRAASAPTAR